MPKTHLIPQPGALVPLAALHALLAWPAASPLTPKPGQGG